MTNLGGTAAVPAIAAVEVVVESPGTERRLHPARVAVMAALWLALVAGVLLLAGTLRGTGVAYATASALLGVAFAPLAASVHEWLVHRYIYHRPAFLLRAVYRVHHRSHHQLFFPTWRYVTDGPARRLSLWSLDPTATCTSLRANAAMRLVHVSFYLSIAAVTIWLPAWLVSRNIIFVMGSVATTLLIADLMVRVHDTIHRPGSHALVERQPWFGFLDRHHFIHHVDTGANLNFLLPLADAMFGTLRRSLSAREQARHGTLEQAKAGAHGEGGPAVESVAQRRAMPSRQ